MSTMDHGPSERALEAAHVEYHARMDRTADRTVRSLVSDLLAAAHDPALGEDMSVRLRDVLDWLLDVPLFVTEQQRKNAAIDLLRAFTEESA